MESLISRVFKLMNIFDMLEKCENNFDMSVNKCENNVDMSVNKCENNFVKDYPMQNL